MNHLWGVHNYFEDHKFIDNLSKSEKKTKSGIYGPVGTVLACMGA